METQLAQRIATGDDLFALGQLQNTGPAFPMLPKAQLSEPRANPNTKPP